MDQATTLINQFKDQAALLDQFFTPWQKLALLVVVGQSHAKERLNN
ncbi:hypothetical protein TcasGA2_TC034447 [Tribolium castaneum]|uniref:Uncharacterized protein n=1 Tax=Tribolium castaneum TaxID=7070 RepID=A0A139WBV4_TRICA|nr:hypothetical protein TcasGA2_TC034447 [Tribolium castaneum]